MTVWVTLPPGFDAGDLLIHARERGIYFIPGRHFYFQNPQPNTLRLGFSSVDERTIARGIQTFCEVLKAELRKRQRGARDEFHGRVALV
jgi:2-aminoadipate transaminase